MIEKVEYM